LTACHAAKVSNANSVADRQLMCYVCEDCAKVTKETPLEACDAAYFEKVSTTEEPTADPTTTTTTTTSTETSTESSTTTELSTTTSVETTTAGSTTEAIPAPSTVGPAPTTTTVPTPPTVGSAVADAEEVDADNATTTTENALNATTTTENAMNATTTTGAPQALPYVADDYSYHCFSVQKI
ncbi:PREDICTED: integumentary mucin C.1-like, partial [Rhagoletis zephyria]|uniref:integumentary mucin C.1-like n=1 Tax=Rhagoletis zephyria TaxID=28612 RepID=UPI0008118454